MSTTLTLHPSALPDISPISRRGQRWRDWTRSLPHRHAWPGPLSNAEAATLRQLPLTIRQRPIAEFAETPQQRVHLGHLQNRRIGLLTVGDCVDAELARELCTWAGVGPTVAHWLRATLLRLAAKPAIPIPPAGAHAFPLHAHPQPISIPVS